MRVKELEETLLSREQGAEPTHHFLSSSAILAGQAPRAVSARSRRRASTTTPVLLRHRLDSFDFLVQCFHLKRAEPLPRTGELKEKPPMQIAALFFRLHQSAPEVMLITSRETGDG
jgi:hypothetical protein